MWSIGAIAYLMLTGGVPPFTGKNNIELKAAITSGIWQRETLVDAGASAESIDFIEKLLVMEPLRRMSAEEALSHPWIV